MLVLSRFVGDAVHFRCGGELVKLVVLDVDGGRVRLGIDADRVVEVWRKEIDPHVGGDKKQVPVATQPEPQPPKETVLPMRDVDGHFGDGVFDDPC